MELHFVESESTFSYFASTRRDIEHHGNPIALYSDRHSVFRNNKPQATGGDQITQFGRALYELNIDMICANRSQTKDRVERANLTLQDRLVKELRLREIYCPAAENCYLPTFTADFNRRFSKPPRGTFDAHRPIP